MAPSSTFEFSLSLARSIVCSIQFDLANRRINRFQSKYTNNSRTNSNGMKWGLQMQIYTHHPFAMIRWWGTQRAFLCCWFFACFNVYGIYFFFLFSFFSLSEQNFACIDCARSHLIYVDIKSILYIYSFVWCDILFANFFGCFMFFVLFFVSPNLVAHLYIGIDFGAAVWSLLSFFSSPSISRIVIHNIKFEFCNGVNVCFCPVDCNNNEQQKCIHLERLLELRICERAHLWHAHQIKYHSIIDCIDDGSNAIFAMSHNNSMMAFSVSTLHISLSLSIHVLFMLRVHKPKKNLSSALGRSDIARKYAHRTHTYRYPHA